MNIAIVLAAFLTWASGTMWPDLFAALGILFVNESAAEHMACRA
jgi:Co/Zn/Cd efflux system component